MNRLPTKKKINLFYLTKLTDTTESTVDFCKSVGLIPKSVQCPTCSAKLEKPYILRRSNALSPEIRYQ